MHYAAADIHRICEHPLLELIFEFEILNRQISEKCFNYEIWNQQTNALRSSFEKSKDLVIKKTKQPT